MADEMTRLRYQAHVGQTNRNRAGQFEQREIIIHQLLGFMRSKRRRVRKQVLFHFLPDEVRQDQPANAGGTKGEDGFIQAPGRHNPSREDVGIEKKPQRCTRAHFRVGRMRVGFCAARSG